MGTPEFSVSALRVLIDSNRRPIAVVTQPDRPKGRGQRLSPPPVKEFAASVGIPVWQPKKFRDPAVINEIRKLDPDLIVVVAFGRILPLSILEIPRFGCVNIHASLLPKYRGAGPVAWAILRGEEETGVTTMKMDEGLDTGDIYLQEKVAILPEDTTGSLSSRLSETGAGLLKKTINGIEDGSLSSVPQDESLATKAPIIEKEQGKVDWKLPAKIIVNLVRGLSPWPGVYTEYQGSRWRLWRVSERNDKTEESPGAILKTEKDQILVATGRGVLVLHELQAPNARRMSVRDFLSGHSVKEGEILGIPENPQ